MIQVLFDFDPDILKYIEIVMASQNGWNMRNDIARGLGSQRLFTNSKSAVVLHLYLRLFGYRKEQKDELLSFGVICLL